MTNNLTRFDDKMLIANEWVSASDGATFEALNPATNEHLATVPEANGSDVDAAVDIAQQAFESSEWRDMSPSDRGRLLWRIADLLEQQGDEIARVETMDQGQPFSVSRGVNLPLAVDLFRYYAGWCTKIEGVVSPVSIPNHMHYTRREPLGVVALITPWNFPLMIAAIKLAPALAAGNTVILKPAEQTSLSTLSLARICREAGVPAGVVNVLTGGPEVGKALVAHPGIRKVSFTGSTSVGKSIVASSAGNLKRVSLELGGKAPSIIARDADIDAAVAGAIGGGLLNSGQVCAAYTRFYVDVQRRDEFTEKLAKAASSLKIGDGMSADTVLGPLVSAEHLAHVERYVAIGREQGAEVVTGGVRLEGEFANGNFYAPTVFGSVTDDMRIAREEIFGPVLSVLDYEDPDELVARANDSEYGLAATIWTRDISNAHRLAARIQAGSVHINTLPVLDPAAPWGGVKSSGWGREMSFGAIEEFTEVKGVWIGL